MPRGNQLTRQWHLLQLLDRPAGVVVDDAARDLDCAARTIWRDLRVLQDAGFPIYDEQGADDGDLSGGSMTHSGGGCRSSSPSPSWPPSS